MSLTDTASAMDAHHGAALVERVIAAVGTDPRRPVLNHNLGFAFPPQGAGPWVHGELNPMPEELLAAAEFPSGRPLSPSLRRWLAFDTSLLRHFGWLDAGYGFTPWTLGRLTRSRYGDEWGAFFEEASMGTRFDECFLLPGGADSCRVLVTGATDEYGEYPVLALDVDDIPCAALMYPGFDVFLADTAGLLEQQKARGYSALADDPRYGARMRTQAGHYFDGRLYEEAW
jgi:hypothetical protein